MSGEINYRSVAVPADKPPEEYTYSERRAEILQLLQEAGHPRALNQRELAKRYDCSPPNISNDMDALAGYVGDSLGDRHVLNTKLVLQRCVQELLDEGEWKAAASVQTDLAEWIHERTELAELRERVDRLQTRQS